MGVLGARNTFRDVRPWHSRLAVLDRQVCRIERLDGQPTGTGFLVAPDIIMTATHVAGFEPPYQPVRFRARFDFVLSPTTGTVLEGVPIELAQDNWLLGHSPVFAPGDQVINAVDTVLARLAEPIGLTRQDGRPDVRGWVDLNEAVNEPPEGSTLAIMQHAEGGPLKLSLNTQAVLGLDPESGRLMYRTDTLPGASGGPCFDMDWRLVAMHEGRDVRGGNYNRGVPFGLIKQWLQREDLWRYVAQPSPVTASLLAAATSAASADETQFGMPRDLKRLVADGESQLIEFKRGIASGRPDGKGSSGAVEVNKVLTSAAAFMNSTDGGTIVIGVEDDKSVVGIQEEYPIVDPGSPTWDGYNRYLTNKLTSNLHVASPFRFFSVTRYHEQGRDICAIHIQPSDNPVFLNDVFYVRIGAQNKPLKAHDMVTFITARWPLLGRGS